MSTLGSPALPSQPPATRSWLDLTLAPVAARIVGTLRDYDLTDVQAIVDEVPPDRRTDLIHVLAAMVDADTPPSQLLDWTMTGPVPTSSDTFAEIAARTGPPARPATPSRQQITCEACGRSYNAKNRGRHVARCPGEPPAPPRHPTPERVELLAGRNWRVRCGYPDCDATFRADRYAKHCASFHDPFNPPRRPAAARAHGPRSVDPLAVEEAVAGRRGVHLTPTERARAVAELDEHGLTAEQIAARLGVATRSVHRARARARRGDQQVA